MKEYLITVVDTMEYNTTIVANSMEDAKHKLKEMMNNGGIVFPDGNCVDSETFITETK